MKSTLAALLAETLDTFEQNGPFPGRTILEEIVIRCVNEARINDATADTLPLREKGRYRVEAEDLRHLASLLQESAEALEGLKP